MQLIVREYRPEDLPALVRIWNEVVEDGVAFPQEELLTAETGAAFFAAQTYTAAAVDEDTGTVYGNASYAVERAARGLHIGEKLVSDCLVQGRAHGFRVLQFNAVVASNTHARHLYERLGFTQLGVIPGGFRMKDGHYEDICPYYHTL